MLPFGTATALFAQAASTGGGPSPILLFAVVGAIWFFLLIRPQMQESKEHREMLAALAKGDTVVTRGGFIVKVIEVKEGELLVDLGSTKARLETETIARKIVPEGKAS